MNKKLNVIFGFTYSCNVLQLVVIFFASYIKVSGDVERNRILFRIMPNKKIDVVYGYHSKLLMLKSVTMEVRKISH